MRLSLVFSWLTAILLVVPVHDLRGQDLNYRHYTAESGNNLPSNEVYGIIFDRNHILWATTDRGVWRYDGYTGRQFTVADGLKENNHLRIYTDTLGRIWLSSFTNRLYRIINDSVSKHPCSDSIQNLPFNGGYIQQVGEGADGSLYLTFNRPGLYRLQPGKAPVQLAGHRRSAASGTLAIFYTPELTYWDMIDYPDPDEGIATRVETRDGWTYLTCGLNNPDKSYRKYIWPLARNEFLFSYGNRVFHLRDGKLLAERILTFDVHDVYADQQNNFWVGIDEGGALRFPGRSLNSDPVRYLPGETVTSIRQDHEGNYWFATLSNGIFQANTLDIGVYHFGPPFSKEDEIYSLASDGENIYVGTGSGKLHKGRELPNFRYLMKEIPIPYPDGSLRKIFYTPEKHLILFNKILQETDTQGRPAGIGRITDYPFDCVFQPDGGWVSSFTNRIMVVKDGAVLRTWDANTVANNLPNPQILVRALSRVRVMYFDSDGKFWMGSQNSGLFSSLNARILPWSSRDTLFAKRTNDIIQAGKNIWVSIADYGLAAILPDSSYIRFTEKDGLSSDIVDVLYAEDDHIIWAGTNKGLNRITLDRDSTRPVIREISYLTFAEGFPSNRIFSILKHRGNLWIGTNRGLIRVNPDFSKPLNIKPTMIQRQLLVNEKPREMTEGMRLKPQENYLVFNFKAVTYRKPSPILYRYILAGVDKDTVITKSTEARYPNLKHGDFTFTMNASYDGRFDPATELTYHFTIQRHWYELRVVIAGYFLLFGGIVSLIFWLTLRNARQRETDKRQLMLAEKRSLLAQMNPHFIFNSLNSIQHFIVQHDEVQANNYLANFSGLIRRILDNSRKNLISLSEEISTLSLYLGMEKLRFENDFDYFIEKDNQIDFNDIMIPPMLLQPFVENAIWHGIRPLRRKGKLIISFAYEDRYITCRIEDNGVGREKAASIRAKKPVHISNGIRNIEDRIDLLNKMNKEKITLKITDLKKPDGTARGTLVELKFPIELTL